MSADIGGMLEDVVRAAIESGSCKGMDDDTQAACDAVTECFKQAERERNEARAAYRDMTERMEQATALLREVQDDSINGLTLGEARALYERVNEFLAGQPAPAKPVVDDAMVERAQTAYNDAMILALGENTDTMTEHPMRAALVAALEGRG